MTSSQSIDLTHRSKPGSEAPVYELLAKNIFPDWMIRRGIRCQLSQKLKEERKPFENRQRRLMVMIEELKNSPVAIATDSANEQHYQVPTEFFKYVLGPRMKYSCALYDRDGESLAEAEERMLALTCRRARISDGEEILELGCGWGSLTLYMAENFPNARITAVSNSATQRRYIEETARQRGLSNITVITCDMNDFHYEGCCDRVVSVEMFEHMKNYKLLLQRISSWLKPGGSLFVHIFSHRELCYHYQDKDGSDWMTRNFFEGGIMPSNDLLLYFQDDLKVREHWTVNGRNYEKTANHWLANMDAHKQDVMPVLAATYGKGNELRWWVFWRLFFMACAELWGYGGGEEWLVSHYLFEKA